MILWRENNPKATLTNTCSIEPQENGRDVLESVSPSVDRDGGDPAEQPHHPATPQVYQPPEKTCKTCGNTYSASAEFFQRCRKYLSCGARDGLDPRCKSCSKARRKERAELASQQVEHPPRYYLGPDDRYHCVRCTGYIYDSGLDGEWYCVSCGEYVNPPAQPARYRKNLEA